MRLHHILRLLTSEVVGGAMLVLFRRGQRLPVRPLDNTKFAARLLHCRGTYPQFCTRGNHGHPEVWRDELACYKHGLSVVSLPVGVHRLPPGENYAEFDIWHSRRRHRPALRCFFFHAGARPPHRAAHTPTAQPPLVSPPRFTSASHRQVSPGTLSVFLVNTKQYQDHGIFVCACRIPYLMSHVTFGSKSSQKGLSTEVDPVVAEERGGEGRGPSVELQSAQDPWHCAIGARHSSAGPHFDLPVRIPLVAWHGEDIESMAVPNTGNQGEPLNRRPRRMPLPIHGAQQHGRTQPCCLLTLVRL